MEKERISLLKQIENFQMGSKVSTGKYCSTRTQSTLSTFKRVEDGMTLYETASKPSLVSSKVESESRNRFNSPGAKIL